jgi:hypothetical protein
MDPSLGIHRERLREKQKELGFKDKKQLIQDNSTRWNSTGSIWQVIPFMEKLLGHFEDMREKFNLPLPGNDLRVALEDTQSTQQYMARGSSERRPARGKAESPPTPVSNASSSQEYRLLCTDVNAGWAKLNKYYALTDMSSSYVAAVVLHPAYTLWWLKNKWASKPAWIRDAERRVEYLWADCSCLDVNLRSPVAVTTVRQPPRVVETDCIFDISDDEGAPDASEDEYLALCQQPRNPLVTQSLSFWTTEVTRRQYPRLSRMVIDLFNIPAMSGEPERTFSSCSLMITSHRGSLGSDVVEYTQCTENWLRNGVISPQVLTGTRNRGIDDEETIHVD